MKFIFRYMKEHIRSILAGVSIKFIGTFSEFMIPYVLEHLLDDVVPAGQNSMILIWGGVMMVIAAFVRFMNVTANRMAVRVASSCIYRIRGELFDKTLNLSGSQVDKYGLPSLISRMTSDSYNVQNFIRSIQTMGVRAPILLLGGLIVTYIMDPGLALILLIMVPILVIIVILISAKGIPLYTRVQQAVDDVVRIMRENITGIRVIKALSKEESENARFSGANRELFGRDVKASVIMALPGPLTTLFLNLGLTAVVVLGAYRVNGGITKPGVILAFLTYFNMILNGINGINKTFMMISKANASADRISRVIEEGEPFESVYEAEEEGIPRVKIEPCIAFENVSFGYLKEGRAAEGYELEDISFSLPRGGSLGIIGATGSGKTTLINLLMRFYDVNRGRILVDGKNVKSYGVKELRRKFGVVFQNDTVFADTLQENIAFGRKVDEKRAREAARDAQAWDFIEKYEERLLYKADIHGANLSGGQKQRILIARALAARPEILVLDDSSSALDYRTDASLRHTISAHYEGTTTIMVAQRISSVMNMDNILVLDEGKIIGQGSHEQLLKSCRLYREIYEVQMS